VTRLLRSALLLVLVVALGVLVLARPTAAGAAVDLVRTDVTFQGAGGVELHGTVLAPAAATGQLPGIVMVHGAGPATREELQEEAEALAMRGVMTLIYDKRAAYSLANRDYVVLANDALGGVRVMREHPDVDPTRVGLWGQSEGAWVAPLAATHSSDVGFVITVGAIGVSPARQQAWSYGEYLRHAGVSGSLLRTMQDRVIRVGVASGLFGEVTYDPVPVWERVEQPVLALWGEFDREAVPEESARIMQQALERGGNGRHTIRVIPGVRHNLNNTFDAGFDRPNSLPPTYGDVEVAWIQDLAQGTPAGSIDPPAKQEWRSRSVDPLAWYESHWLQLGAMVLFVMVFGGYLLIGGVRWILRRRDVSPLHRPARLLAATGLLTTLGFITYIGFLIITAGNPNLIGPVILGQPVPWLLLQVLAVATVAALVVTAVRWWRRRREAGGGPPIRLGALWVTGLLFVPWAWYWGVLG
jgi:hypothetical protein